MRGFRKRVRPTQGQKHLCPVRAGSPSTQQIEVSAAVTSFPSPSSAISIKRRPWPVALVAAAMHLREWRWKSPSLRYRWTRRPPAASAIRRCDTKTGDGIERPMPRGPNNMLYNARSTSRSSRHLRNSIDEDCSCSPARSCSYMVYATTCTD